MGVTITYSGKIKDINRIPELVTEFKDICETMNWKYSIYDDSFNEPISLTHEFSDGTITLSGNAGLRGISFKPHKESEPVNLTFHKYGQASSIALTLVPNEGNWIFTKTQFAGIDTHIRTVELLEYAAAKYFEEFHIEDDCEYVQYRDRKRSLKVFRVIDDGIAMVSEAISSIDTSTIDMKDDDTLFKAIEDRIRQFMKNRKKE